jgi:hypothetical protein
MLSAGQVLQVYTKGSAKPCHVLVAPDWKSIVWQDPKNAKKIGALDLRAVGAVHAGVEDGHKCANPPARASAVCVCVGSARAAEPALSPPPFTAARPRRVCTLAPQPVLSV